MEKLLVGLLIGGLAGILSGLAGVGGGIVIVPLLTLGVGLDQHTAQGTSLLAFSLPVLGGAAWQYWRQGRVEAKLAVWVALGLVSTGFLSSSLAQNIPTKLLARIFAGLLTLTGFYLLWRSYRKITAKGKRRLPRWLIGLIAGATAGLLSGLAGLGGGIVIVPLLILLGQLDQHTAQGTSLLTLSFPVLIFALWPYAQEGRVEYLLGLGIAAGLLISGSLSARIAQRVPTQQLSRFFAIVVIGIGLYQLLR
ncbi:MAG: sulfite exporter TauE/SafE family protein [Bacteroidetes bacterium]|nr:MAG: sulfite exporter TauE/SafE family protein [Bacteroidota bacterium]